MSRVDEGLAADLLLAVLSDVDRFERAGDLDRAVTRLGEFLKGGPPSDQDAKK